MKRIILILACLCCTLHAQQPVTVLNNGAGGGTFNTPGVTTYFGGANTFNFVGSVVTGLPANVGNTFTTLAVTGTTQLNGAVGIGTTPNNQPLIVGGTWSFGGNFTNVAADASFTQAANAGFIRGVNVAPTLISTAGFTGATYEGIQSATPITVTGTFPDAYMVLVQNAPVATSAAGITVATQTNGVTNNTDILYGTTTIPTSPANNGIYQGDAYPNFLNGVTGIGSAASTSNILTVGGSTSQASPTGITVSSTLTGNGAIGIQAAPQLVASASNTTPLAGILASALTNFNTVNFTGLDCYQVQINTPSATGTGTIAQFAQLLIRQALNTGGGYTVTAPYGILQSGTDLNQLAGEVTAGTAGSAAIGMNGPPGAVTGSTELLKTVSAIANNTGTPVLTVTIPNAAHSAKVHVELTGSLGAGGAIGANEATGTINYDFAVARTAGVNAVTTASTAYGSAAANVAGATTITITAAASAISGAVGASNSFTVNVTIARGGGASTNHTCLVDAKVVNANATGITIN